jgi:hypothetical protein
VVVGIGAGRAVAARVGAAVSLAGVVMYIIGGAPENPLSAVGVCVAVLGAVWIIWAYVRPVKAGLSPPRIGHLAFLEARRVPLRPSLGERPDWLPLRRSPVS